METTNKPQQKQLTQRGVLSQDVSEVHVRLYQRRPSRERTGPVRAHLYYHFIFKFCFPFYPKAQVRQEWVGGTKIAWTQLNLSQNGPVHELRHEHSYDRINPHPALTPENEKTSRVPSLLFSSPRARAAP